MIGLKHNVREAAQRTMRFSLSSSAATAKALTYTARDIEKEMPGKMAGVLDRPTMFTQRGFYSIGASASKLQASVGVKPLQARYLRYQIMGGMRRPSRVALKLPSVVSVNEYGNIPAGLVKQLIARAKAGRRATKTQARRFGVSQQLDLFYGDPGDGRPAGIYKRVALSPTRHQLIPVIVMPQKSAHYEKRFDFYGSARATAQRRWQINARAALFEAQRAR